MVRLVPALAKPPPPSRRNRLAIALPT